MDKKQITVIKQFTNWQETIERCLDPLGAAKVLRSRKLIIIKPNLLNDSPHPITTHPDTVRALAEYIRKHSRARLIIAEGCGDSHLETTEIFARLGYDKLVREYDLELVDLNHASLARLQDHRCRVFPEIFLPRLALKGFLISLPVLKRHSLAQVTLCMKNMMGLAPPSHYQQGGMWKKAFFHNQMHRSIFELNRYRLPDLSIIDATVGMAEYHLGGKTCDPPVGKMVAGYDPVAADSIGASLLGLSWKDIPHIRMAHNVLGKAVET